EMITYFGPPILGSLAELTSDPEERRRCLEEAERILESECTVHNHFLFARPAIELSLRLGDWDNAQRYAQAIEEKFCAEPVPIVTFTVQRAHALIAAGRGGRDPALLASLERLASEAREGYASIWAGALEQAAARLRAQI
ncbi:MAG TPA: adenylate/guanylate cyclase domain-containing protein, partial [Burkholderiales bacterium]